MKYPNFKEEKQLWRDGVKFVVGLDEAGRGPLAGPVVAAAVLVKKDARIRGLKIQDSKKLTAQKREYFYKKLTNHKYLAFGVGIVSEKIIDKINILEATKLAMKKALVDLDDKLHDREICYDSDFLLIDGNFVIPSKIPQRSITKGDDKVFSISAAGIIAKVTRDRIMQKFHKKYPKYGFNLHKGYGTKLHLKSLRSFGPSKIHRKSFFPVKTLAKSEFV